MYTLDQFSKLFALDIRNIIGLLFWGNLALSALVFTFHFTNLSKDHKTNLLWLGCSKILQSFAWLAFFLRPEKTSFTTLNIIVSNNFIFTGFYMEAIAMLMLAKNVSKKTYRTQTILLIAILLSFCFTIYFKTPTNIRLAFSSFAVFLLLIIPSLQFLTERKSSQFRKILAFNYMILLITLLFRSVFFLFNPTLNVYSSHPIQYAIFLILFLMMIISGLGYLLLLQEEKERKIRKLLDDKDQFFSIIAHDLKGPFNGIIGLSELLLENDNQLDDEETKKFIQLINQSSKNTYSLLENLLFWAQSQTGSIEFNPKELEINSIVNRTIGLLSNIANTKNITIHSKIEDKQYIIADKDMLETIFRNLISNAIKFTRINGEVTISMIKENKKIIISVEDNGIGIETEKIKNLFSMKHRVSTSGTNNETGTGLGLMLCKDFIKKHHGEIWVKSQPENGTAFMFSIPNS